MNLKSNKAITLVALIITIIVLLILAGVSLSMVLGDNGLINKAQSSVNRYQESYVNEQNLLNEIENYLNKKSQTEKKQYFIGQSVNLNGYDFYVIEIDETSITLLCKTIIGTATWANAKSQASTFGSNLGGTGRLLTKAEAEGVAANYRNIGKTYWLADAYSNIHAWVGNINADGGIYSNSYIYIEESKGVCPVVTIEKDKLA